MTDEIKASHDEVEERVNYFYALILDGYSQADAVNIAHTNTQWGRSLTKRWLRELYQRAEENLADEARNVDRRSWLMRALKRYERLYHMAYQAEDLKLAASMQDRIVDLLNLSAATSLTIDWRDRAQELGIEPSELFDRLLADLAEQHEQSTD